jgi:hypothetical protein
MPFEADRVAPTQFPTLFGQKVEKGLQRSYPPVYCGLAQLLASLQVDKLIDILYVDFSPFFLADLTELA